MSEPTVFTAFKVHGMRIFIVAYMSIKLRNYSSCFRNVLTLNIGDPTFVLNLYHE